jgi:hypothetical protein
VNRFLRYIRHRIWLFLGVDTLVRRTTRLQYAHDQLARDVQKLRDLLEGQTVLLGDMHLSPEPHALIIVATRLGGGRVSMIETEFTDVQSFMSTVKTLREVYKARAPILDGYTHGTRLWKEYWG